MSKSPLVSAYVITDIVQYRVVGREEHKENLLSLSVLDQAEPGFEVISRKQVKCLHVEARKTTYLPPRGGR